MNDQMNEQPPSGQSHEELTRMVTPEIKKMGTIQRIISLFIAPGELMRNIKAYPVVLVPLILSIAIGLLSIPVTLQGQELMSRELSNISIERYGFDLMDVTMGANEYGDDLSGAMDAVMLVTTVAGVIIGPLLISFFGALGLFILSKILRGQAKLGQFFSLYLHLYILSLLGGLISVGLMIMTDRYLDMTSLASVLMPDGNISMFSFNVLSYISVFSIWLTILSYIGVKIINDFSSVKAVIVTAIATLVGLAIHVGTFMSTFIMWDMMM